MKVIPGPRATGLKFAFRVNKDIKISCTANEPAVLKSDIEKQIGLEYVKAGLLEVVENDTAKKPVKEPAK